MFSKSENQAKVFLVFPFHALERFILGHKCQKLVKFSKFYFRQKTQNQELSNEMLEFQKFYFQKYRFLNHEMRDVLILLINNYNFNDGCGSIYSTLNPRSEIGLEHNIDPIDGNM